MAVVNTGITGDFGVNEALSGTISLDGSGTGSKLLLVTVAWEDALATGITLTGMTYNGVALSFHSIAATGAINTEIWHLVNPAAGFNDLVVTWDSEITPGVGGALAVVGYSVYEGIDAGVPLGTAVSNTGNNSTPTVDVTGVSTLNLVADVVGYGSLAAFPTLVVGAGQSQLMNTNIIGTTTGLRLTAGGSEEASLVGAVTMSWSLAPDTRAWVIQGVEILNGAKRLKDPVLSRGVVARKR